MTSFERGEKCKKDSDCSTNICQMTYENGDVYEGKWKKGYQTKGKMTYKNKET